MSPREDISAAASRAARMHRAARASVARMWRAARHAVAQSPQSLFWRELAANPGQIGAICASSPRLAARMAAWVDLAALQGATSTSAAPGLVVELGGGTGVITAALLARGVPRDRLAVIEYSPVLAAHLARRFPGVRIIEGDAAQIGQYFGDRADLADLPPGEWPHAGQAHGAPPPADFPPQPIRAIVSGLPLLSMPHPVRARIVQAVTAALAPDGRLIQFTYTLRGRSPWQSPELALRHSERVLANLPPARIDVLTR